MPDTLVNWTGLALTVSLSSGAHLAIIVATVHSTRKGVELGNKAEMPLHNLDISQGK